MLEKIIAGLAIFFGFLVIVLIIAAIVAFPFMWLWNACLVGTVAGIGPITSFWHALGLLILSSFLFKSSSSSSK